MILDSLDVSYGEMWGSGHAMTHPDPMSRAVAARRHAAEEDYAVLLAARERPLALLEYWPNRMWRVYLFDDRSYRTQMIDLKCDRGKKVLWAHRNTRWQFSSERQYLSGKWDVQETTTVSANGEVEIRSEFSRSEQSSVAEPENVTVRRFSAPIQDFLLPAPEFGDWQVFVRFLTQQGHEPATTVVLNEVSMEDEQGPLRATGIEQLFTPGTRDTPDGPAVVELTDAGLLRVPSGQLIVSDPGLIDETSRRVTVPPGEFPVTVSLMRTTNEVRVAAAKVTLLDAPPSEWEMVIRPEEDLGLLGEGQFYGVGVDTGTVAFLDATRPVSREKLEDDLIVLLDSRFTVELAGPESEPNLIAFRAGWGDGYYPVWIGRTEDGQTSCVVIDFRLYPAAEGE